MLVIRVELWSAITGENSEIARMIISNDGTSRGPEMGSYNVCTLRGSSRERFDESMKPGSGVLPQKSGRVEGYPRKALPVWDLVARALASMGYK